MIGKGLIDLWVGFVKFALDLLPTAGPPDWVSDGTAALSTVWSYGAGLGAWIPWPVAGAVVSAVLASVAIGLGIKLARIVASFFTVGGGSAG